MLKCHCPKFEYKKGCPSPATKLSGSPVIGVVVSGIKTGYQQNLLTGCTTGSELSRLRLFSSGHSLVGLVAPPEVASLPFSPCCLSGVPPSPRFLSLPVIERLRARVALSAEVEADARLRAFRLNFSRNDFAFLSILK